MTVSETAIEGWVAPGTLGLIGAVARATGA
jgi:hypothetical protein